MTAAAGRYIRWRVRHATHVRGPWLQHPSPSVLSRFFFFGLQQTSPSDKQKFPSCSTTGCLLSFFVAGQRWVKEKGEWKKGVTTFCAMWRCTCNQTVAQRVKRNLWWQWTPCVVVPRREEQCTSKVLRPKCTLVLLGGWQSPSCWPISGLLAQRWVKKNEKRWERKSHNLRCDVTFQM